MAAKRTWSHSTGPVIEPLYHHRREREKKGTHKCHLYRDTLGNVSVAAVLISPADMTMNITGQTKLVD